MKDPKKEKNNRKIGENYEQAAGFYLEQHGCRIGEIDIVAKEGENLVFCEVKYRTGPGKGSPLEAVDARKQRKIFQAAMYYLTEHHISDVPCRFDVIGIEGTRIQLVKNAFCG